MRPPAGGGKRVPRRHATLCGRRRRIMTAAGRQATRQRFDAPLAELIAEAAALRDCAHGRLISYSRKVFIPLTKLCRDVCHYCTFAEVPRAGEPVYLSPDEVLAIARAGAAAGCTEALFTLGDKPELRYQAARDALKALGHETTISYLTAMCALVLRETGLLPHANPGVMTRKEIAGLREVTASQGIMLESTSELTCSQAGAPASGRRIEGSVHDRHPDRHRRDTRRADRRAGGDSGSARRPWKYPGSHRSELPGQARHQARQFRGTRSRRPAVDHRDGASDSRARHEYPGAAKSVARSLSKADRRGAQRLGRHLAGHARSREPRSAVACHCRTRPQERGRRQAAAEPPARLPRLRARRRYVAGSRHRHPRAAHERR